MKRGASPKISKSLCIALLAIFSNFLISAPAVAGTYTETFGGTSNCALQVPGMSVTQNSTALTNTAVNGFASLTSWNNSYGTSGCTAYIYYANTYPVVYTFPSSIRPTSFTFWSGAVDGTRSAFLTYTDGTTSNFTFANVAPTIGESKTVTGNGKLIVSFTVAASSDFYAIDNISWEAGALPPSTVALSTVGLDNSKGLSATLTATISTPGRVTFFANNKRIANCISLLASGSVNCNWRPTVTGAVKLKALLIPTDGGYSQSIAEASVTVINRGTFRTR